jgi:nitrate/TMAO reductase-like tetraheme cytochrome c subunit
MMKRLKEWLRPAVYLGNNPISLAGAVLTTSTAILLIAFWIYMFLARRPVLPYNGIVFFFVVPALFVLGLLLMPIGGLLRRRRLKKEGKLPHVYPTIDLHQPVLQRAVVWVVALSFVNFSLMGMATYKAIEHMDTVEFCGKTCHTVMAPEYTAYLNSPHSRVSCVECHIGSGAPWFVKAKISGMRQLFAVNLKTYSKPIPSPVENLRPARDTCEHCHWPERFTGDKLLVKTKYADDEQNTPATTVLLMKVGGRTTQGLVGIHGRHLAAAERLEYVSTDGRRQVIPRVIYTEDDGKKVEYVSDEVKTTPADLAKAERRQMDCVDCHNRPTHAFQLPERAVDEAISAGRIDRQLPFIKKQAVAVLRTEYPDRGAAAEKIPQAITEFYKTKYPDVYQNKRPVVETAAQQVAAIYARNVFPEMKLTWGTHPNNIGHEDFLGCFRCHDGKHKTAAGKVINDDCSACHQVLAMEEKDPKILADLGLK